jgi:hypothetical protein
MLCTMIYAFRIETARFANFEPQQASSHQTAVSVTGVDFNTKAFPKKPSLLRYSASSAITSAECPVQKFLVAA